MSGLRKLLKALRGVEGRGFCKSVESCNDCAAVLSWIYVTLFCSGDCLEGKKKSDWGMFRG